MASRDVWPLFAGPGKPGSHGSGDTGIQQGHQRRYGQHCRGPQSPVQVISDAPCDPPGGGRPCPGSLYMVDLHEMHLQHLLVRCAGTASGDLEEQSQEPQILANLMS